MPESHTSPRITIITPCFNDAATVERTICSVLDQGYDNLQYIVVDGGSRDGSDQIIRRYRGELACWIHTPCQSSGEAINHALKRADGEIVGVLPADDLYLPEALARVAKAFQRVESPNWVIGRCVRIGARDEELGHDQTEAPHTLDAHVMRPQSALPLAATFYRRRALERVGAIDPSLRGAPGYELIGRLLATGEKPTESHHLLAAHRRHTTPRSIDALLSRGRERIAAAQKFAEHLPLAQRYAMWRSVEQLERIYALAERQSEKSAAARLRWRGLLDDATCLCSAESRHALLQTERDAAHSPAA